MTLVEPETGVMATEHASQVGVSASAPHVAYLGPGYDSEPNKNSNAPYLDAPPPYTETRYSSPGYTETGYGSPGYTETGYGSPGYTETGYGSSGFTETRNGSPGYPDQQQQQQRQQQQGQQHTSHAMSIAEDSEETMLFSDRSIRQAFIKKVFAILSVQLIVTAGIVCLFFFVDSIKEYIFDRVWVPAVCGGVALALLIVIGCCGELRRKFPANIVFLFLLTLAMSALLGSLTCYFDVDEILMALGILVAIVIVMMILGFQTKFDLTWVVGLTVAIIICGVGYGICWALFRRNYVSLIWPCLGALLFSLWLLSDIQMIVGGKHKVSMDPEEYILAVIVLYTDIVYIFIYILLIIGGSK